MPRIDAASDEDRCGEHADEGEGKHSAKDGGSARRRPSRSGSVVGIGVRSSNGSAIGSSELGHER